MVRQDKQIKKNIPVTRRGKQQVKYSTMAEQSRAEQSRAEQSRAEQSRAEQSRAEQSRAEQSRAEQIKAEQIKAEQGISIIKAKRVWLKRDHKYPL